MFRKAFLLYAFLLASAPCLFSETRSAQDMAKECRVALDLAQGRVEKTFEHTLFLGECIGYTQDAADFQSQWQTTWSGLRFASRITHQRRHLFRSLSR